MDFFVGPTWKTDKVGKFLNIKNRQEIIFVRGTTEAINLVAYAWGRQNINEGDIIRINTETGEYVERADKG